MDVGLEAREDSEQAADTTARGRRRDNAPPADRRLRVGVDEPWAQPAALVARSLGVEPAAGLSAAEARVRLSRFGRNALQRVRTRSVWAILRDQLKSFITGLLAVGAVVSFAFGHALEGGSIVGVIALNTTIGFITELRAVRSMEALRGLGRTDAVVRRGSEPTRVPAEDLVPGDVVILEGGDVVTADTRLYEASRLQASESALTGESVPIEKTADAVGAGAPLAERSCMAFKGTSLTRGAAVGIVVGTGMHTELGRIAALVEEADESDTPLEKRLDRLGRSLAWASVGFVVLVAIVAVASGRELFSVIQIAIALAVATVPEGLPIVATLALARGMWRMARRKALIEELPAVETLGSTDLILTDKTGTLTENRMTVVKLVLEERELDMADGRRLCVDGDPTVQSLLTAAALCTDAAIGGEGTRGPGTVGDPMEIALLAAAESAGLHIDDLRSRLPEVREEAFDPGLKMMATVHAASEGFYVAVKGAPEAVLDRCTSQARGDLAKDVDERWRAHWIAVAQRLGARGLRTLAIASKSVPTAESPPYSDLELLGLVGLEDPPRAAARDAIDACLSAGVRVVMVTGDQAATAAAIARAVGIAAPNDPLSVVQGADLEAAESAGALQRVLDAVVVARTSPEQKLRLLAHHQAAGRVVAMIGDGVNDAPALKKADIGIAMGKRGTQVAREAAAMVLQDDEFSTITVAIEQGRVIFRNIRAFVVYLVSCNLSEILTIGLASAVSAPLPILPLQILFLNLVTDVFPALALGVGEGDPDVMGRPPRDPRESFLTRSHWIAVIGYGLLLSAPVLGALAVARLALDMPTPQAVTVSFLTLAFSQVLHVFNMAQGRFHLLNTDVTRNPWIWGAVGLCAALLVASVYAPGLTTILGTENPGAAGWAVVAVASLVPLAVGRIIALGRHVRSSSKRA